jgi:hypothetical protein
MLFDTFGSLALREIFLIFNYFEYVAMLKIWCYNKENWSY